MKKYNSLSDQLLLFLQNSSSTPGTGCASFIDYLQTNISKCKCLGKVSAALKLESTYKRFYAFLEKSALLSDGDLCFKDINSDLLILFERSMKEEFLTQNTTSFYLRVLRSYYNKGINEGLYFSFVDPFKSVYTGVSRTQKRAIDEEFMVAIKEYPFPKKLHFARDIFLFSFFMRGMSFIDISKLKTSNLLKDELRYCRSKTGQSIRVKIEPCAQEIINKYSGKSGNEYLFPILYKNGVPFKYNSSLKNTNNHLRKISQILNLEKPITTYTARHSWASIARKGGVPISTISEGMGHTSERTTQIYLSSLNQNTIDDANRKIIQSLNKRNMSCGELKTKL